MDQSTNSLPAIDLSGRKILVADDDRSNILALDGILKSAGYVLAEADSAARVLEVHAQFLPDLMLLDLTPGVDGFATYRKLKKIFGAQCASVIFITASNLSEEIVEGLDVLGFDYVLKPVNPPEVLGRVRAQLQNQFLVAQQRLLVEELNKANTENNRLLTTAARDLRDPLASIDFLAGFLRDGTVGTLTPDQLDLADTIHAVSRSMLSMVRELLDVASIESNKITLQLQPTNLAELIAKAVYVANMDAAKKKTRIEFLAPAGAALVSIDPDKMKQVIDNLISNAVKYSPPGAVIAVTLHTDPHGGCSFAVQDQGPGIPANEHDKLFKEFGRLSVQPTGGEKSTGLGLAICRRIVEAHAGTITAENLPGRGCEFRVTLPPHP